MLCAWLSAAVVFPTAAFASLEGKSCPTLGKTIVSSSKKFTCVKSGKNKVWNAGVAIKPLVKKIVATPTPTPKPSASPLATPTATPTIRKTPSPTPSPSTTALDNPGASPSPDSSVPIHGKFVVTPQYVDARWLSEGLVAVARLVDGAKLWGYIDTSGNLRLPFKFQDISQFSQGLAGVQVGSGDGARWGYIDTSGDMVIPAQFDYASVFTDSGLARVSFGEGGVIGYIDRAGKLAINPTFTNGGDFSNGLAAVLPFGSDKWGYINTAGVMVIPAQFDWAEDFGSSGVAPAGPIFNATEGSSRMGLIDVNGNYIVPPIYRFIFGPPNGPFGFAVDTDAGQLWGFIDLKGNIVIKPQFVDVRSFSEGLAPVQVGKLWGFIDQSGKMVVQPKYDFYWDYGNGLAAVLVGDLWGFIN